jgi:hypothetical protein
MDKWRIRQQRRRTQSGLLQKDVDDEPPKKTSSLEAVKHEYERCRDEWKVSKQTTNIQAGTAKAPLLVCENLPPNEDSRLSTVNIRLQMIEIFQMHNPSKVDEVDTLLQKYTGDEEALLDRIKKKYTAAPPIDFSDVNLPGSRVFMDFTVDGVEVGRVRFRLYDSEVPLTTDNFRALCTGEKV